MGRKRNNDGEAELIDFEKAKEEIQKQIDGAEELDTSLFSTTHKLEQMNSKHALILSYGGKPVVLSYVYNEVAGRNVIEFVSPEAIMIRYSNDSVQEDRRYVQVGTWWLKHAERREYKSVFFDPGNTQQDKWGVYAHDGKLNLWQGFNIEPRKGSWKRTRKHIYKILCNGDKHKFKYLIRWFAFLVQHPDKPAEVAAFLKGKQGSGKGFIFKQFTTIFGRHAMSISSSEQLTGNFSGHLERLVFMFADEACVPNDYKAEGKLKQLITEPEIAIRAMRRDAIATKNRLHIGAATNNDWVLQASEDSRRYFINEVDNRYAKGEAPDHVRNRYFDLLFGEMDNGGREAMLYDLLRVRLGNWHPRQDVPETNELKKQRHFSLKAQHRAVFALLDDGIFPGTQNKFGKLRIAEYSVSADELKDHLSKTEPGSEKIWQRITAVLKQIGATKQKDGRIYWIFPELDTCRANWGRAFGRTDWDDSAVQTNQRGEPIVEYVDGEPVTQYCKLTSWQLIKKPF